MRRVILAAMAVAVVVMPAGNYAEAAKRIHKPRYVYVPDARGVVVSQPDWTGNNANSMSGDNSAVNNATGRTSGSGWGG
jgi:hypothetical protein